VRIQSFINHKCYISVVLTLFFFVSAVAGDVDYRTFQNKEGNAIEARILEVADGTVQIERRDGVRFSVAIHMFSDSDQKYIEKWLAYEALRNTHHWAISASSQLGPRNRDESSSIIRIRRDVGYEITLANRTSTPFTNLLVRYRVFIRDTEPAAVRERRSDRYFDGEIKIENIPPRESLTVLTKTDTLNETRLRPGWVWSSGAPPSSRDTLRGIYFQILYDGEVVQTFARPSALEEEMEEERPLFFFPRERT